MMGRIADRVGTRWTVICGALMIGVGPGDLDPRPALAAVDRPRPVHRPDRARRHQCAALHLCQPLVRPPARLGAGADLERQLSRRRGVAAGVRARHRRTSAGARPCCGTRSLEIAVIVPLARSIFARRRRSSTPSQPRAPTTRSAPVLGWPPNLVFVMMCAAAVMCCIPMAMPQGTSGRLLQRSRHRALGRRHHAVGAARHRVPLPADLGRDLRPHRRAVHRADRLGLAVRRHDRVAADAEAKPGCSRCRPSSGSAFPASSRLTCWRLRELFPAAQASVAHSDAAAVHGARHGARAAGSPACCTITTAITPRPSPSASASNILNILVMGTLVARGRLFRAALA